jgi:hypothetical protein
VHDVDRARGLVDGKSCVIGHAHQCCRCWPVPAIWAAPERQPRCQPRKRARMIRRLR